jgi:hypothetical protein
LSVISKHRLLKLNHQLHPLKLIKYSFESLQTYATTISNTVGHALNLAGKSGAAIALGVSGACFLGSAIWSVATGGIGFIKTLYKSKNLSIGNEIDKANLNKGIEYIKRKGAIKKIIATCFLVPVLPLYLVYKGLKTYFLKSENNSIKNPFNASDKWQKRLDAGIKITGGLCIILGIFIPFAQPLLFLGIGVMFSKPIWQGLKWVKKIFSPKKEHVHLADQEKAHLIQNPDHSTALIFQKIAFLSECKKETKSEVLNDLYKKLQDTNKLLYPQTRSSARKDTKCNEKCCSPGSNFSTRGRTNFSTRGRTNFSTRRYVEPEITPELENALYDISDNQGNEVGNTSEITFKDLQEKVNKERLKVKTEYEQLKEIYRVNIKS